MFHHYPLTWMSSETGITAAVNSYIEMLQDWLFPQLNKDSEDFIFQQDGAPPHCHNQVRRFLK